MKRAKTMLLAIAVVGIVGGVFAFKAQKFTGAKVYTLDGSTCAFLKTYAPFDGVGTPVTITNATISASVPPSSADCTSTVSVSIEN